jgi:polyhydroxyalkanoate synthesis repressor PhaR
MTMECGWKLRGLRLHDFVVQRIVRHLTELKQMSETRVIRKYANRRLYDATASRHVTLEDIRKLIGAGEKVQVVDDRSGADLTRQVLLQIISEQEQFGAPVLSVQLLEGIIRFYGNPVQNMLSRYLEQSLGTVITQQRTVQAEMAKALESPLAPLSELARQNMEIWTRMQASMLAAFNQGAGGATPGTDRDSSTPPPPAGDKS